MLCNVTCVYFKLTFDEIYSINNIQGRRISILTMRHEMIENRRIGKALVPRPFLILSSC